MTRAAHPSGRREFCGALRVSADLSGPVTDRALFHADNAYFYPDVRLRSKPMKTNTVSNTAFRGFGGPQGMLGGERMIEEVAYKLGKDPLEVRRPISTAVKRGNAARDALPPDGGPTTSSTRRRELEEAAPIRPGGRRSSLQRNQPGHQEGHRADAGEVRHLLHRHLVQSGGCAGACLQDGSIHLNHGGTEMGQGLNTKVAQVWPTNSRSISTRSGSPRPPPSKVPNTSATAASSGTDLNGMAAANAASRSRPADGFCLGEIQVPRAGGVQANHVRIGNELMASRSPIWSSSLSWRASSCRRQASTRRRKSTGTAPAGKGNPFYYFAYGAAVSEVSIDTLTGEYQVDRVDVLHDVGKSLNPASISARSKARSCRAWAG
jgi:xanthine dehydrogenase large subunit